MLRMFSVFEFGEFRPGSWVVRKEAKKVNMWTLGQMCTKKRALHRLKNLLFTLVYIIAKK